MLLLVKLPSRWAKGVEVPEWKYLAQDPNWRLGSTHALSWLDWSEVGRVEWSRIRLLPEVPRATGQASAGEESVLAELLAVERAGWSDPPRCAALGGIAAVVVGVESGSREVVGMGSVRWSRCSVVFVGHIGPLASAWATLYHGGHASVELAVGRRSCLPSPMAAAWSAGAVVAVWCWVDWCRSVCASLAQAAGCSEWCMPVVHATSGAGARGSCWGSTSPRGSCGSFMICSRWETSRPLVAWVFLL